MLKTIAVTLVVLTSYANAQESAPYDFTVKPEAGVSHSRSQGPQYVKDVNAVATPTMDLEVEITPDSHARAESILNRNPLNLGTLRDVMVSLTTSNDNLILGDLGQHIGSGGRGQGLQGDDQGYTFGVALGTTLGFDRGSISIDLRSDLYGRLTTVNGRSETSDGRVFTNDIDVTLVNVAVRKDLQGKTFVVFKLGVATLRDQEGFALGLQERFHDYSADRGRGVRQYLPQDHMNNVVESVGGALVGRKFTLYKNGLLDIGAEIAVGASFIAGLTGETVDNGVMLTHDTSVTASIRQAVRLQVFSRSAELSSEAGANVIVPMFRNDRSGWEVSGGAARYTTRSELLRVYRDSDLDYRLKVSYVRRFGVRN